MHVLNAEVVGFPMWPLARKNSMCGGFGSEICGYGYFLSTLWGEYTKNKTF